MALQDQLQQMKGFDINDLDPENIGSWPLPIKIVIWVVVFVAVVVGTHQAVIKEKAAALEAKQKEEATLKADFELKVQEAANLEKYRAQMVEMEKTFSAMLSQLPKDTEVPGLLDDITEKGVKSGLSFQAIDLKPEKKAEFYVELPIEIKVAGGYHDFGGFVSALAGLPRIVTLHDFTIVSSQESKKTAKAAAPAGKDGKKDAKEEAAADDDRGSEELTMSIVAKTYRYKSEEDAAEETADPKKGKGKAGAKEKDKKAPAKKPPAAKK